MLAAMSQSGVAPSPDNLVGHTVGRFTIDGYVGEEQLGKVYSAAEQPGGRRVTLKVLNPTLVNNYEGAGRFQREMLASATVAEHPNAVAMLDFGDHHGIFHYLVMEAFDARSLGDDITQGPMDANRVARIAYQIASVLNTAHQSHIVHRNLTPENILLLNNTKGGDYVKIRDFGLARMMDPEQGGGEVLTSAGARVGTVTYQAPEYIEGGRVDPRGDLYALGILMYEMLAGQPPFRGKKSAVIEQHCDGPVPRPSAEASGVPPWLDDLVFALLAKEPEDRPRDGGLVMQAIGKGLGVRIQLPEIAVQATKSQLGASNTPAPAEGSGGKGKAVAAAAGAGVLLFGGVGAVVLLIALLVVAYLMM
jgi:eukaryotic-like serine/threonine-protein kinase